MADSQYDMSPKMQELFKKKQELRTAAKEYYRKQLYNPYIQNQPVDPVLFRYTAMSAYSTTYYRPNNKHRAAFLFTVLPIIVIGWVVHNGRSKEEQEILSGRVAYADRKNKLIL